MSRRMKRRMKTGVMVYPLDTEKINAKANTEMRDKLELEENVVIKCANGEGFIRHSKNIYWLDREGVIFTLPIDEDNPVVLPFYTHTDHGDGKSSTGMFSCASVKLDGDDLEQYIGDEGVPLENFVRSFGQRLEGNFWGIVEFLRDIKVMEEEE